MAAGITENSAQRNLMRFGERIYTLLRISILSYQDYKNIISSLWGDFIFWVKSPLTNVLLIECDGQISKQQIKSLLLKISKNWSKLSKNEVKPFCPYVYLHGIPEPEIIEIKQALQNDGVYFVDGYDFKGAAFSPKSITRKPSAHNEIKLKFITDIHQISDILNFISTTRIIYQFYLETPFYENNQHELHAIKVQETQNIEKMI